MGILVDAFHCQSQSNARTPRSLSIYQLSTFIHSPVFVRLTDTADPHWSQEGYFWSQSLIWPAALGFIVFQAGHQQCSSCTYYSEECRRRRRESVKHRHNGHTADTTASACQTKLYKLQACLSSFFFQSFFVYTRQLHAFKSWFHFCFHVVSFHHFSLSSEFTTSGKARAFATDIH